MPKWVLLNCWLKKKKNCERCCIVSCDKLTMKKRRINPIFKFWRTHRNLDFRKPIIELQKYVQRWKVDDRWNCFSIINLFGTLITLPYISQIFLLGWWWTTSHILINIHPTLILSYNFKMLLSYDAFHIKSVICLDHHTLTIFFYNRIYVIILFICLNLFLEKYLKQINHKL